MQEFLLFFQEEAGQGGGIGPIGKAADKGGALFQGPGAHPLEDLGLFVGADDLAAVQDGAEHPAGPQGLEGSFQRRDAALGVGEHPVVGTGQSAEIEHHGIDGAGLYIL